MDATGYLSPSSEEGGRGGEIRYSKTSDIVVSSSVFTLADGGLKDLVIRAISALRLWSITDVFFKYKKILKFYSTTSSGRRRYRQMCKNLAERKKNLLPSAPPLLHAKE